MHYKMKLSLLQCKQKVNWSNITKHTNLRNTPNTQGTADPRDVSPCARRAPSMPKDNQKNPNSKNTLTKWNLGNRHISVTAQLQPTNPG